MRLRGGTLKRRYLSAWFRVNTLYRFLWGVVVSFFFFFFFSCFFFPLLFFCCFLLLEVHLILTLMCFSFSFIEAILFPAFDRLYLSLVSAYKWVTLPLFFFFVACKSNLFQSYPAFSSSSYFLFLAD